MGYNYATHSEVMAAGIVLPVIAATIIAARFYARSKQELRLEADDWLIATALVRSTCRNDPGFGG